MKQAIFKIDIFQFQYIKFHINYRLGAKNFFKTNIYQLLLFISLLLLL